MRTGYNIRQESRNSSKERTETMTQDQEGKKQKKKLLSVVVSVYNEEQALEEFYRETRSYL